MEHFIQQAGFVIRLRYWKRFLSFFRKTGLRMLGMQIGKNTTLPAVKITWPHQVAIGSSCVLEDQIYFKFDGIRKPGPSIRIGDNVFIGTGCEFNIRRLITIGNDSLIASGCRFIDHDHGVDAGELMRKQHGLEKEIVIGRDVWLGCNVVVLKGVVIGDGAVVAAGAVLTKSVLPNEIWGGVPAKKIGERPGKEGQKPMDKLTVERTKSEII
jgi:acetyltransferase-like isoleucine patch superfamily enzyme